MFDLYVDGIGSHVYDIFPPNSLWKVFESNVADTCFFYLLDTPFERGTLQTHYHKLGKLVLLQVMKFLDLHCKTTSTLLGTVEAKSFFPHSIIILNTDNLKDDALMLFRLYGQDIEGLAQCLLPKI